jgi:hypothetical protein
MTAIEKLQEKLNITITEDYKHNGMILKLAHVLRGWIYVML